MRPSGILLIDEQALLLKTPFFQTCKEFSYFLQSDYFARLLCVCATSLQPFAFVRSSVS
jgi:hypothetical protein